MSKVKSYIVCGVLPAADEQTFFELEALTLKRASRVSPYKVLSEAKAFEAHIETMMSGKAYQTAIIEDLAALGIKADVAVMSATDSRNKALLICDMDSTLIGQECIDELADFAGAGEYVAGITERAMRGELDFDAALTERVGLLKGLPLSTLQTCFDQRITMNKGARILARTMAANGAKTVIVSGGFTFFSQRVANAAGFDHNQANILLDDGAVLTGKVKIPILGREAKKASLETYSADIGGPAAALAIGDGANDLAMITTAGLGIAYRAKPAVAAAAHCAINHTDLTTALYFQGYNDSEFIAD
ncbi:phosphoserine phosphatase SerB [Robiginitomaculum antarcticum]|uniref:phosphoserine phosphatase SerB n=1 Tax=Robiginitomaculum antarcticum TaxID=437507 RepID=UPI00036D01D3|nr:phosphoserine phosphatase SerB [Robiginitomaculum antarcticum]